MTNPTQRQLSGRARADDFRQTHHVVETQHLGAEISHAIVFRKTAANAQVDGRCGPKSHDCQRLEQRLYTNGTCVAGLAYWWPTPP